MSYLTKILPKIKKLKKKLTAKLKKSKLGQRILPEKHKKVIIGGFFSFLFLLIAYFFIFKDLPNPNGLRNYRIVPFSTKILDRNGQLLYEIYRDQNRTPVNLTDLPEHVLQATIAIEDKDFFHHQGVSLFGGIIRAIKDTILKQRLQGGSTITQQLVKSALLTPERTIQRKVKEIILALWTERIFTKEQILEMYLNQVPYGGSSYGIEEASKTYFGKSSNKLTLEEAAFLAGLPRAPSLYSPHRNPDLAKSRRGEVLEVMLKEGYISKEQFDQASKSPLEVIPLRQEINAPHFVFYVKSILEEKYGADLVEEGGLKVYTTLDLEIQQQAEEIVKEEIEKIKKYDVTNGAVLVTRPPSGEILAMVGSDDYFATPSGAFNVTTAQRQPGSAIKPINYAIGLERKLVTPATVFLDIPTCFSAPGQPKAYCPRNYDGQFHGPAQLRFALGNSYNIPAVKMLAINGVESFVASSSAFLMTTFKDPQRYGLSLTLGGGEVKMTEMAQAFSAFANEGVPKKLVSVLKVVDKNGEVLYQYKDSNLVEEIRNPLEYPNFLAMAGERAISKETAFLISHILLDNNARSAAFGPSSYLVIPGHAVSVKTGTTDDKRDNWTVGYTPNFLVVVWVGNNDNTPMNPYVTSGLTGASPIWHEVMTAVLENQPDLWPRKPDGVVGRQICVMTGTIKQENQDETNEEAEDCQSRFEYFIKGTTPEGPEVERAFVPVNRDTDRMTTVDDPNHELQEKTVIKDAFSTYCLDCNHEGERYTVVRL